MSGVQQTNGTGGRLATRVSLLGSCLSKRKTWCGTTRRGGSTADDDCLDRHLLLNARAGGIMRKQSIMPLDLVFHFFEKVGSRTSWLRPRAHGSAEEYTIERILQGPYRLQSITGSGASGLRRLVSTTTGWDQQILSRVAESRRWQRGMVRQRWSFDGTVRGKDGGRCSRTLVADVF